MVRGGEPLFLVATWYIVRLMADTGSQKYLTALEKKRKNEERSTGTRKGDAQVAAEQRKRAAKSEDSAARRSTSKPSAPPKPTPKPAPKSGPTRDAPAYRGNKTTPKPGPKTPSNSIKPTGGFRIPTMPELRKRDAINKERSGTIGAFPSAKKKK